MLRLHLVPEAKEDSGVFQVALKLAAEDGGVVFPLDNAGRRQVPYQDMGRYDEIWVHGMWLPRIWSACHRIVGEQKRRGIANAPRLVRMTHGSLSPVYLERQSPWKKRIVSPIERHYFGFCDRVVVTGKHEEEWCRQWKMLCRIEITDLKRFFHFPQTNHISRDCARPLRVLYLGRRHPLKGISCLEKAVQGNDSVDLRVETSCFGDSKEQAYQWCDVFCLPTLSDNFGLVVAEALEHGKPVITTDGAPVWKGQAGVTYLEGFREGCEEARVAMLAKAIGSEIGRRG